MTRTEELLVCREGRKKKKKKIRPSPITAHDFGTIRLEKWGNGRRVAKKEMQSKKTGGVTDAKEKGLGLWTKGA